MKVIIIAVRDQKANTFGQPGVAPNISMALRAWAYQLNDPQHSQADQAKWPSDFSLWHLGEYDDETGVITPLASPQQLAIAQDLMNPRNGPTN